MSQFGNFIKGVGNIVSDFLGLDAETADPVWKVQQQSNIEEAQKQRLFEKQMADLQYQRSTPANQMRLYREAGLNPSLMYGQMSDLQTSIPSGAEASFSQSRPNQLGTLLGLGPDIARVAGELSTIPEQKDLLRAQAADAWSRVPLNNQRVLNLIQDVLESKSRIELNGSKIANMDTDTLKKAHEAAIAFIKEQFENEAYQYRLKELKATAEERRIASVFAERMALADLGVKYSTASLNDALKDYHVQITPKQVALLDELAELYHQQHTTAQDYREFFDKHKEEDRFLRILFQALTTANDAAGTVMDGYELKNGKTVKVTKL